jgi:murein DD-endopeptidase MepM/ murein hydrolase activator NlpD
VLAGLIAGASLAGPALAAPPPLQISGRYRQGGFAIGRTAPGATVSLDGETLSRASAAGWFFVGFDRDAPISTTVTVTTDAGSASQALQVMPGDFDIQTISGLPRDQVAPSDPALLTRIGEESALKTAAQASRLEADHFHGGFAMPLETWRVTGRFGGQRILNGVPKRPHYGCDLAAAAGTPILAPAAGVVAMAAPAMHFEGGLTMLDHGQGLISFYLHQSRLDVEAGQTVSQGQVIGAVGMTGRATGPHLCWRLKWRDRNLDPMLLAGFKLA